MQTYLSLLRGINVSGQKKIKMADLKLMYESLGFEDVTTYIQSGNVIFKTKKSRESNLEEPIKKEIRKTFGFEVPVLVLCYEELLSLAAANPYKDSELDHKFLHFTLLSTPPDAEKIKVVNEMQFPGEEFLVTKRVVYLCLPNGYGRTKLNNNFFESKLKVSATTRNLKSVNKLIELAKKNI
ncbi:MAG: hypothetical protein ACI8VT_002802 [Saprospiraceae bacterium]|jgi:uncharacterized protein (DUF1697 family)